ncbi:MAG TPA: PIG-L family deacetylase [Verrucomicrobiae bacterium]
MMNPYQPFVSAFARLVADGKSLHLGGIPPHDQPRAAADAPVALIFSPHPDDECIVGGLALRFLRENKMRVVNVAVTLGSDRQRRQPRLQELKNACDWIGFELELTAPNGLEKINPQTRTGDPAHWNACVQTIAVSLAKNRPRAIFFPHELDRHPTHIGTHFLVLDALKTLPPDFQTTLIETEFWGQMPAPNLMVESGVENVAGLLAALSFHVGEVRRNPYHLRLPAWLADNVRRGAELVGGQGGAAPDFMFATLYRTRQWNNGRVEEIFSGGRQIGVKENPGDVFGWR